MNRAPRDRSTTKYYTVKEVAERQGSCERSVRRKIAAKLLIAHRFGRLVRISEQDLLNYERLNRSD
jgi:excisionase family DNA binding protein